MWRGYVLFVVFPLKWSLFLKIIMIVDGGNLVLLSTYLAKESKLIDTEDRFVFGSGVIGELELFCSF